MGFKEQALQDNLKTFSADNPLGTHEIALLEEIASGIANLIPCTGCRYCCDGCPMHLDIPMLLSMANDMAIQHGFNTVSRYTGLGDGNRAADCIGCGQCARICPQKIDIPSELKKLASLMAGQKTWEEVCRERAEAAARRGE